MVHSILVANPKGGSGKSTLATNLAAYYAGRGLNVMLGDVDRQQTSRVWLSRRPESCPRIGSWDLAPGEPARPPRGTRVMILDSAAGLHGKKLTALLRRVDHVLVPIQPSPFDMWASEAFFQDLLAEKALRKSRVFMGVVGMRVDSRTRSARELEQFLVGHDVPVLGWLRDTQMYVQAAANGLGLFDLPPARSVRDRQEWEPVLRWLDAGLDLDWCDK